MKGLTVLCNIVLFFFTCFVLATDGAPREAAYIVLTLMMLLIPVLTAFAIVRSGPGSGRLRPSVKGDTPKARPESVVVSSNRAAVAWVAAICNIVLLGVACWAIVDQYPHPKEEGVVAYAALALLTPLLSAIVLLRSGGRDGRPAVEPGNPQIGAPPLHP